MCVCKFTYAVSDLCFNLSRDQTAWNGTLNYPPYPGVNLRLVDGNVYKQTGEGDALVVCIAQSDVPTPDMVRCRAQREHETRDGCAT